jgi:hypothetical protein
LRRSRSSVEKYNILSRIGYVTRLITSLCQGCSGYSLRIRFYTYTVLHITITLNLIQSNVSISVQLTSISADAGLQLSSVATIPTLLSSEVNARLLIYLRALLLNEPFVITVDTPVRITAELLLFPRQRFRRFHRSVSSRFQTCNIILEVQLFFLKCHLMCTKMNLLQNKYMLNFAVNINLMTLSKYIFISGARFLFPLQRPDRLWGPLNLMYNGYQMFSPWA